MNGIQSKVSWESNQKTILTWWSALAYSLGYNVSHLITYEFLLKSNGLGVVLDM